MLKNGGNGGTSGPTAKVPAKKKNTVTASAFTTGQNAAAKAAKATVGKAAPQTQIGAVNSQVTPAAAPAAAPAAQNPVDTYYYSLTPDQTYSYLKSYQADQQVLANQAANQANLQASWQNNSANLAQQTATGLDNQNQSAAARGIFQSSINDGALADITANAVQQQNAFNSTYNTGMLNLANSVSAANQDITDLANQYNGDAAQNAAASVAADPYGVNGGANGFSLAPLTSSVVNSVHSNVGTAPKPVSTTYSSQTLPSALKTAQSQVSGVTMPSTTAAVPK